MASPKKQKRIGATPYLCAKDAARAIEFYKQAFGATETARLVDPGGKVSHAELNIGGASIFLADEFPDIGVLSPQSLGGSAVTIVLDVADVDSIATQAVAAGAKLVRPVENQFYGARSGKLQDPFGHTWIVGTQIEEVSPEEMKRRAADLYGTT